MMIRWIVLSVFFLWPAIAAAGDAAPKSEEVQVEKLKQKYWSSGEDAQVTVVQNRIYSKERKFTLGLAGGVVFSDPFLSLKAYQGSIGYHFGEYFGLSLLYWSVSTSPSNALTVLRDQGKDANVNPVKSMVGAEALWSVMYGKLSLFARKIIYYDMHLSAGAGNTTTDSGTNPTGLFGIGQRFYVNQTVSVRFDYRSVVFNEKIIEKVITTKIGQVTGERVNWGHSFSLGFDFMFGGAQK